MPGKGQAGTSTFRPSTVISRMSPDATRNLAAVSGATSATLSHVSFVSGLGNSCNQPLLAKRPSQTVGSGVKVNSSPDVCDGATESALNFQVTSRTAARESETTPSCTIFRQRL